MSISAISTKMVHTNNSDINGTVNVNESYSNRIIDLNDSGNNVISEIVTNTVTKMELSMPMMSVKSMI